MASLKRRAAQLMLLLLAVGSSAEFSAMYGATMAELSSSGISGTSWWGVEDSVILGLVDVTGYGANLTAANCTATNACSVQITEGASCTSIGSAYTSGGHQAFRSTDASGNANFVVVVEQASTDIAGKLVVVYGADGSQAACGPLGEVNGEKSHGTLSELSSSSVAGKVNAVALSNGDVAGFGVASGLAASLTSVQDGGSDCTAANGCGVHVHAGTNCGDDQGGHYWRPTTAPDPWATGLYRSTNAWGRGHFIFYVAAGTPSVKNMPFIVHDNAGGRVACGLLDEDVPDRNSRISGALPGAIYSSVPAALVLAALFFAQH